MMALRDHPVVARLQEVVVVESAAVERDSYWKIMVTNWLFYCPALSKPLLCKDV
jgi:hypothetical protein